MSAIPIVSPVQTGPNNADLPASAARVRASNAWRDLSTVVISPTRGSIPTKIVQSWMSMLPVMNQKLRWMMSVWMEVGAAYEEMVAHVLENPEFSKYKYILTIEEDNAPPQDGLQKLFESIESGYDVVGGLYWTKGDPSMPLICGDPKVGPNDYKPQIPTPDSLQECNALGMGFTLFKMDMFRQIERPWFKTVQDQNPESGWELQTQDVHFFSKAAKAGFRFAVDTRVKVGHYEISQDRFY